MIYIPRIDNLSNVAGLVDLAVALATGNVEPAIANQYNVGDDQTQLRTVLLCNSNIRATNGSVDTMIIGMDDDDVTRFVPEEGKAKAGFLFVAVRAVTETKGYNVDTNTIAQSYLNDLRQILNQSNAILNGVLNIGATGDASTVETTCVVAYGYLKETQTEDYNPLDKISTDWEYKMFDPSLLA